MDLGIATKTEQEYKLNCEIRSKLKYYEDETKSGKKFKDSTEMIYLVPQSSSQQVLFYDAWLPSVESEVYEVAAIMLSPINKTCRLGMRRMNRDCQDHHLVLMSVEIEDEVKNYVKWCRKNQSNNKNPEIRVNILPASEEEKHDV
jgi:hypothetical protein